VSLSVLLLCLTLMGGSGCVGGPDAKPSGPPLAPGPESTGEESTMADDELPGLGPETLAQVPAGARQVLIVTGAFADSFSSEAVLYQQGEYGWEAGPAWQAYNALRGWTDDHHRDDLRSPIGVFTLSDAGGLLPDPGARLPYHQSPGFAIDGVGFHGEALAGSFDHVIAIDYNRRPGTSPLDRTRPLGEDRGGGIWLHVDHQGPTQGCVSLSAAHLRELLRTLDPALRPVVVMGDVDSLAR
jgi:hypothetical protein